MRVQKLTVAQISGTHKAAQGQAIAVKDGGAATPLDIGQFLNGRGGLLVHLGQDAKGKPRGLPGISARCTHVYFGEQRIQDMKCHHFTRVSGGRVLVGTIDSRGGFVADPRAPSLSYDASNSPFPGVVRVSTASGDEVFTWSPLRHDIVHGRLSMSDGSDSRTTVARSARKIG